MPKTVIEMDPTRKPQEQKFPIQNRWHPDIPIAAMVKPGDSFRVECMDWTGGQVNNDDSAADIRDCNLLPCHHLSGPVGVQGAEPGDLLVVDILDLGPFRNAEWGYTGIFSTQNGGGFLTDVFPEPCKAIWDCNGIFASSRHIPGVRFAAISHPGILGCAPSHELLARWNKRERALIDTNPHRVPPLALPPEPREAMLGGLTGPEHDKAAVEAARTIPPREHGGNCDIEVSRGTRVYLPVYVPDAKLTTGDLHFSQGDGEITFCGAIEMHGWIDFHVNLIKGGMEKYKLTGPIFQPGRVEPHYSEFLVFEGLSVDDSGEQHYLDVTIAYRRACLNAINYLTQFGFSGEQAYIILSCAPVEGRVSGVVNIPNACVSVYIPTEIFEFDIRPNSDGPKKMMRGRDVARI